MLIILILIGTLSSCNNIDTSSNINTDTNTDIDTSTNVDTDVDVSEPAIPYEKYGNKVYFALEENENIYYTEIRDYEETETPIDFPKEKGAYLKIINSYNELNTYISATDLDENIFNENYVICINQYYEGGCHDKKLSGYYNFSFEDGEYSISLDYYYSVEAYTHPLTACNISYTNYILVPKNKVSYIDKIQKISVNGKEHIGNDGMEDERPAYTHWYVKYDENVTLPKNPASWVVKKGSELQGQLGLEFAENFNSDEYRVILYLPNEPQCDFIIKEKSIKNGDIYITVELYKHHTNEYLENNDVKFYDLYIEDSSILSENYNVHIAINKIDIPYLNAVIVDDDVDEAEAIIIAQEHFFNTYFYQLNGEYYYVKSVRAVLGSYGEAWEILIVSKNSAEEGSTYNYVISKENGAIIDIKN